MFLSFKFKFDIFWKVCSRFMWPVVFKKMTAFFFPHSHLLFSINLFPLLWFSRKPHSISVSSSRFQFRFPAHYWSSQSPGFAHHVNLFRLQKHFIVIGFIFLMIAMCSVLQLFYECHHHDPSLSSTLSFAKSFITCIDSNLRNKVFFIFYPCFAFSELIEAFWFTML